MTGRAAAMRASECKCVVCKTAQAVAFWPCIDPDIRSRPYCRACLDKAQKELLVALFLQDEEDKEKPCKKSTLST